MSQAWEIRLGDAREALADVAPGSARTCVTSPPYWGLRDYGTGSWEGGDPACDHRGPLAGGSSSSGLGGYGNRLSPEAIAQRVAAVQRAYHRVCARCGAERVDQQIGLEDDPDDYVAAIVATMGEVRRVLTDDGTLWLNLGDSYASKARGSDAGWDKSRLTNPGTQQKAQAASMRSSGQRHRGRHAGLKEKDLVGMPWMVAFALRADGWYLRSDVIWHKPSPMPESIRDRPTSAHEHVFLLTKQPRYFYDGDAIRTRDVGTDQPRSAEHVARGHDPSGGVHRPHRGLRTPESRNGQGANARNVWTIASQPFTGAHFACMPPDLASRCIRAGSEPGDLVLDPFAGAGTTGMVALRHDRRFLGVELNPEYVALAERRIEDDAPLFNARPAAGARTES